VEKESVQMPANGIFLPSIESQLATEKAKNDANKAELTKAYAMY